MILTRETAAGLNKRRVIVGLLAEELGFTLGMRLAPMFTWALSHPGDTDLDFETINEVWAYLSGRKDEREAKVESEKGQEE